MAACYSITEASSYLPFPRHDPLSSADLLTHKIVAYFESEPIFERCRPQPSRLDLSDDDRSFIKREWHLKGPQHTQSPFIRIGSGMKHLVYTHDRWPHLAFKPMNLTDATHQAYVSRKAIELVESKKLFFIHIPPGEAIKLQEAESDPTALYAEERLPIQLSANQYTLIHRDLMDYLDRRESPLFENNFKRLISQIAAFIWEMGYDDVTNENGPLFDAIDGKEVYFTDFDDLLKDPYFSRIQAKVGIEFLFEMFPHEVTRETLLPLISQLPESEKRVMLDSLSAILKESNWDLLDRSDYRQGAFLF